MFFLFSVVSPSFLSSSKTLWLHKRKERKGGEKMGGGEERRKSTLIPV
jgi:hypothetical protein